MNRIVKLILLLLAIETSAGAAGAIAWAWRAGVIGEGDLRHQLLPVFLLVFPLIAWGVLAWASRRLAADRPRLAEDHRRHLQGALVFHMLVLALAQGWLIYGYVDAGPPPLDRESFARLAFILMGVALAVRGNFVAKVSPPTGEGAPDAGAWTRSLLRSGWLMTLAGAAMVVCALALPVPALVLLAPLVALALIAIGQAHRRAVQKGAAR